MNGWAMACRNAWERRPRLRILPGSGQILRPKLRSGLESLPASQTRSMFSFSSSSTPPLPSSYSGRERHCRVCGDSKLVVSPFSVARRVLASFMGNIVRVERGRAFQLEEEHWEAGGRGQREKSGVGREGAPFSVSRPRLLPLRRFGQLPSFTEVRLPVRSVLSGAPGPPSRPPGPSATAGRAACLLPLLSC